MGTVKEKELQIELSKARERIAMLETIIKSSREKVTNLSAQLYAIVIESKP